MKSLSPPKPHKSYKELVDLLESRGMTIPDRARAERKLSQIGYYRLSGFWYPCREFLPGNRTKRGDQFQRGTNFNTIIDLYLFDKKLRQLMLDAIERIEIYIRTVIAHEMGFHNPLAYKDRAFINPKYCRDFVKANGSKVNKWNEWEKRHDEQMAKSKEDCIVWHRSQFKEIPFWVAIECWDFGIMSKYYEMLNDRYKNRISARLGIANAKILNEWLREINTLRNRCAHHTRIWNQSFSNPIKITTDPYFQSLVLDQHALTRIFGMTCVLWFLVKKIGPSSGWIAEIADIIDSKPSIDSCPNTAMGFPDNSGFPRAKFHLL